MKQRGIFLVLAVACLGAGFFARTPDTGGVALRDFEAYYSAGATWRYHGDPYGREIWRVERTIPGVVTTRDEILPFVGPPFGLPLWDAISRLPWPQAVVLWRIVMGLSFAAIVLGTLRVAAGRVGAVDALAALVFGATFAPLTSGVALGQVAVVSCAAIVAMPLLLRIRFAYASAAGALAAGLQPNLALVLIARLREPRSWIAFAGAAVLAAGGSVVTLESIGGIGHYLTVLRDHAQSERYIAIQTTVSAVARAFGAPPHLAAAVALVALLAVCVTLAAQYARGRYAPADLLALACAALPLATPFAHEHDFNVAFFPAMLVLRRARGPLWFAAAAATIAIGVDWLGIAQRPGSTLEAAAFAFASGCAIAALACERTRPTIAVPLCAAIVVALVALPGARHVLPTWPDRLPPAFHMPRQASAAEVWGAEQAASGIGALDPYWALLRLIPLGGCAVLFVSGSFALTGSRRSEPLSTSLRPQAEAHPSA